MPERMPITTLEQTEMVIRERSALTLEGQSKDRSYSGAPVRPSSVGIAPSVEIIAQADLETSKQLSDRVSNAAPKQSTSDTVVDREPSAVTLPRDDATPRENFAHTLEDSLQYSSLSMQSTRMVRYDKPDEILVYTSGQAIVTRSKNGAGCAVLFETEDNSTSNPVAFPLEKEGPTGGSQSNTPFAAALRAVLAALELKTWGSEGWKKVIIATDDERVYRGMTHDIFKWASRGWLDEGSKQHPPRPQLWRRALELINKQEYHGCEVKFLLVTAEQNQHAADLAREIARSKSVSQHYQPCGDVGNTSMEAL